MFSDVTEVGKHRTGIIAGLFGQLGKVDAAAIQARRCAGLQSTNMERQFSQSRRQRIRGWIACPPAFIIG